MKLLTEFTDFSNLDVLTEKSENGNKVYRIKGPFLQAEIKNKNGRIYSGNILGREVKMFNEEKIQKNRALGELDHPPTPTINLKEVSHRIESLVMEGNDGIGIAKLLDTPTGRIAQSLIKEGILLGVSTRGVGSINGSKVNDDYRLITIDIVADPSAPNAFVDGVLENKEFIVENNQIVEVAVAQLEEDVKVKPNSETIRLAIQEFLRNIKF